MKTANILQDIEYNDSKPVISVLFETDFTKEIRIAMKKGTVMKEHKTSYSIVVQIIEGNIDFGVQQKTNNLNKGSIIALEGGIPHDLKANENSIIRLTLTKNDTTQRVEKVAKD
ncbi:AraC family ligand binding domain-containing protein [Winogradskyella sp.]|jgi:quercetin dioxygenase-like cupin family protein|uniref:AraC family ligand binding domain-containing protein n=1 Tax=Winogradskyella sp. TaxID=1883156 RepID=UPI0025DF695E|nr:AraC family ligand binding domain-containing protein [Winogradskyella sp.]MCT4628467.1 AraC family ligand binding domain-containing protein [Winogradskyella sp.]